MSRRKKSRKQTETQKQQHLLQKIHVEIPVDYELLAKEILKQQELLEKAKENVETDQKVEPKKKIGFWNAVVGILCNRRDTEGRLLTGSMSTILTFFFYGLGSILLILSVIVFVGTIAHAFSVEWNTLDQISNNISIIALIFTLAFLSFIFGITMIGSGHEIGREEDRNYIVDVFSGIFGFVALIVSLIALFKQ